MVRETLAHSYSLWTTKDRQCCDWLMTGGPDDVSELPNLFAEVVCGVSCLKPWLTAATDGPQITDGVAIGEQPQS